MRLQAPDLSWPVAGHLLGAEPHVVRSVRLALSIGHPADLPDEPQHRPWRVKRENRLVSLVDLVCLVHLVYSVSLVQPNKQDKPNKPPIKRDRPDRPDEPVSLGISAEARPAMGSNLLGCVNGVNSLKRGGIYLRG